MHKSHRSVTRVWRQLHLIATSHKTIRTKEDLPVLIRIRLWSPAGAERHNTATVAYTCARARLRRVYLSMCVYVSACVWACVCGCAGARACVYACAAVSTARIGMSGMIGIEFFKNAFSPGAPPRRRWRRRQRCIGPGPRRIVDMRAACRQTRAAHTTGRRRRPWRGHNRRSPAAAAAAAKGSVPHPLRRRSTTRPVYTMRSSSSPTRKT